MRINEWEKSGGHNTLPEARDDSEEQLRVILYCIGRLKVLIEDEDDEVNRKQLRDLEQLLLLWMRNRAKESA